MDLIKYKDLDSALPLRAYPKDGEKLNTIIIEVFVEWVSGLLSLSDDTSAERLEIALPAIKEHCWSMGFVEIKKMFEMYADNKLSIKPIPNYFDRVLFGKIVEAYKQQKPIKKKIYKENPMVQEEIDARVLTGTITCFDDFVQNNYIKEGNVYIYEHLEEKKVINFTAEEKWKQMPIAKDKLIKEFKDSMNRDQYKSFVKDLENKRVDTAIINKAKMMLLEGFFSKLISKGEHIKDLL